MFALLAAILIPAAHADCDITVDTYSGPEYDFRAGRTVYFHKTGADACDADLVVDELPWATAPATDGADFDATRISYHFPAGTVDFGVHIDTYDDHVVEPDEVFGVWLEDLVDVTNVTNWFTVVTMENDDGGLGIEGAPFLVDETGAIDTWASQDGADECVNEWRAARWFHIYLDSPRSETVSVVYEDTTPSGLYVWAATPGVDYEPVYGIATFAPGQTDYYFEVPFYDDSVYEGAEDFEILLHMAEGAELSAQSSVNTRIVDDEDCEGIYCW